MEENKLENHTDNKIENMEEGKGVSKKLFDKEKLENSVWIMWISLILFAPMGVFLLWSRKRFNIITRIILSIVFMVWYFFYIGYTKNLKG